MESVVYLVILAIAVMLFYGTIKRIVKIGEEMSLRGLEKLNDEQKKNTNDWYVHNTIKDSDLEKGKASKEKFNSLDL